MIKSESQFNVESYLMESKFWIERIEAAKSLILDKTGIRKLNRESFQRMKRMGLTEFLYNLEEYPSQITKGRLLKIMNTYSAEESFPSETRYSASGNKIPLSVKEGILTQANFTGIPEKIELKFGILVRRDDLRAFPTEIVFAKKPANLDQDTFQLTSLSLGSPVVVLHKSKDHKWSYIQSTFYKGWIKSESIALTRDKGEIFTYINAERFLVVTGSKVETEPNPFARNISNLFFQMGDKIPLASFDETPFSIPEGNLQAQSPEGCYVVMVPRRDKEGYLEFKPALMARSNDLHEGYLPYTRKNLIKQAFKMLGERYGWGGMFKRRDCSRFIMDIYRTFGIVLPRDVDKQEAGPAGKRVIFKGNIKDRENILAQLKPGDPLYMKGHVMMYLGRVDNCYYVIHAGAGYGIKDKDGGIKPVTLHGVSVMELHHFLQSGAKTYLEALTSGRQFQ